MLARYYTTDECTNIKKLYTKLNTLKKMGKISYNKDTWGFTIKDLELSDDEIEELLDLFYELDVINDDNGIDDDADYNLYDEDFNSDY